MGAATATLHNILSWRVRSPDRLIACEYTGPIYSKTENEALCPSPGRPIIRLFGPSFVYLEGQVQPLHPSDPVKSSDLSPNEAGKAGKPLRIGLMGRIRAYFLAGILVTAPVA